MIAYRSPLLTALLFALFVFGSPALAETDRALESIDGFIAEQDINREDPTWRITLNRPPEVEFDQKKTYYWVLDTSKGEMKFELFPDVAPMHVSNTIYLSRLGFYKGLIFHRIIKSFMAQGGDPLETGVGHPGYTIDGEFTHQRKGKHRSAGVLSAANSGPGTDGSQFFITFKAFEQLDGKHTVYGRLVDGKMVLRAIGREGSKTGAPRERIAIKSASVTVE